MRRSTRPFVPQAGSFTETGSFGAAGLATRSARGAAFGKRSRLGPPAGSRIGTRATESCESREVRSVASV
eukprot:2977426-Pleurochrysis_carterae.AAC.1